MVEYDNEGKQVAVSEGNLVTQSIQDALMALYTRGSLKENGGSASAVKREIADRIDAALERLVLSGRLESHRTKGTGHSYTKYTLPVE